MKKFILSLEERSHSVICTISEFDDGQDIPLGIGSIMLSHDDSDLIPHIKAMVDGFNRKYYIPPPQTETGRGHSSGREYTFPLKSPPKSV